MRTDQRYAGAAGLSAFNHAVRDTLVSQRITTRDPHRFRAHLTGIDLGDLRCVAASVGPLQARRRPRDADRTEGSVFLLLTARAQGMIEHRHGREPIAPGRLVVVPGREPFDVTYRRTAEVVFVVLDAATVADRFPHLDGRVRSVPVDGLADVASRHLHGVVTAAGEASRADRDDAHAIVSSSVHLVLRATGGDSAGDPRQALRAAVERAVALHLTEPELGIGWLSRHLHVSPRQIHRAFEASPWSPAEYIREQRLQACAAELAADPRLPVTVVAARYGFASGSHLGTWFHRRFGASPTQWRRRHESDRDPARI